MDSSSAFSPTCGLGMWFTCASARCCKVGCRLCADRRLMESVSSADFTILLLLAELPLPTRDELTFSPWPANIITSYVGHGSHTGVRQLLPISSTIRRQMPPVSEWLCLTDSNASGPHKHPYHSSTKRLLLRNKPRKKTNVESANPDSLGKQTFKQGRQTIRTNNEIQ